MHPLTPETAQDLLSNQGSDCSTAADLEKPNFAQTYQPRRLSLQDSGSQTVLLGVGSLALASALGLWLTSEASQQQATAADSPLPSSQSQPNSSANLPKSTPLALPDFSTAQTSQQVATPAPQWSTVPTPPSSPTTVSLRRLKVADKLEQMVDRQAAELAVAQSRASADVPPVAPPAVEIAATLPPPPLLPVPESPQAVHSSSGHALAMLPTTPRVLAAPLPESVPFSSELANPSAARQPPQTEPQPEANLHSPALQPLPPSAAPTIAIALAAPSMAAMISSAAPSTPTADPNQILAAPAPDAAQPNLQPEDSPQAIFKGPQQILAVALPAPGSKTWIAPEILGSLPVVQVDWQTYQQAWMALQVEPSDQSPTPRYGYIDYTRKLIVLPTQAQPEANQPSPVGS
jgi:hypothetical protein